jgi:hypothetical protein
MVTSGLWAFGDKIYVQEKKEDLRSKIMLFCYFVF